MRKQRIGAAARYLLVLLPLVVLTIFSASAWAWCLTALLILLPPVSLCVNFYVRRQIRTFLELPTTAAKETASSVILTFRNDGWLPAMKLRAVVEIINDLTGEKQTVDILSAVGPKRETRQEFLLQSGYCGRMYIALRKLTVLDYSGLFGLIVKAKASGRITVLPELFSSEVRFGPRSAATEEGTADRRGDDRSEVFQLREYHSGDDVRQIHWKLSSKLDTLIFREPNQSVNRSLLLFWDKRHPCSPAVMDAMADAAASVAQAICDSGMPFDLAWTEEEDTELRPIPDSDALLQTIPALVKRAGGEQCRMLPTEAYGRIIYLTARLPEAPDEERTMYLLCAMQEQDAKNALVFTPANRRERLERLEI